MEGQLRPSLISSFNLNHSIASPQLPTDAITLSNHYWPRCLQCNPAVDVYLLMENDADKWRKQLNVNRGGRSALDFFSALSTEHCQVIARQLVTNASLIAGAPIVAITSFFPEISLERDESTHDKVVSVLQSLFLVAAEIFRCQKASANKTTGAIRMPVVQLVAGSTISDIEMRFDRKQREVLYAKPGNPSALRKTILNRLDEAINNVDAILSGSQHNPVRAFSQDLRIAFELEPGPLYLVKDGDSLVDFAKDIASHESSLISQCVGFNLDIAHWSLVRNLNEKKSLNGSWLMNDRAIEIRKRIFHAHVSGHSERGHLGDTCLTTITPKQIDAYKDWLSTLQGLPSVEYVSLEFEAAKSMDEIDRSLQLLASWL